MSSFSLQSQNRNLTSKYTNSEENVMFDVNNLIQTKLYFWIKLCVPLSTLSRYIIQLVLCFKQNTPIKWATKIMFFVYIWIKWHVQISTQFHWLDFLTNHIVQGPNKLPLYVKFRMVYACFIKLHSSHNSVDQKEYSFP